MINPYRLLSKITGQNQIITLYHAVSNSTPLHLKHLYKIKNLKEFEDDLIFYQKYFEQLQIKNINHKIKTHKPLIFITFDDGLREFKTHAFPLLQKYNFTPILFINTGFVDNKDMLFRFKASLLIEQTINSNYIDLKEVNRVTRQNFENKNTLIEYFKSVKYSDTETLNQLAQTLNVDFQNYLETEKPYLSINELKELQQQGVIMGAHSIDHPLFNELLEHNQIKQIEASTNFLNNNFQQAINTFSFPFTDFGLPKELFEKIYQHPNFKLDYSFGCAGLKREKFHKHIHRIPMEKKSAKTIIKYQYLYFLIKAPFLKNTIKR